MYRGKRVLQQQIELILTSEDTNRLLKRASESAGPGTMIISYIKLDTTDHRNNYFTCQVTNRDESEIRNFIQTTPALRSVLESASNIERAITQIREHQLIDSEKQLLVFFLHDRAFYIDRIKDVTVLLAK